MVHVSHANTILILLNDNNSCWLPLATTATQPSASPLHPANSTPYASFFSLCSFLTL